MHRWSMVPLNTRERTSWPETFKDKVGFQLLLCLINHEHPEKAIAWDCGWHH